LYIKEINLHTACLDWTSQSPTLADFLNGDPWRKHSITKWWKF